jgi:hypothetical protein
MNKYLDIYRGCTEHELQQLVVKCERLEVRFWIYNDSRISLDLLAEIQQRKTAALTLLGKLTAYAPQMRVSS